MNTIFECVHYRNQISPNQYLTLRAETDSSNQNPQHEKVIFPQQASLQFTYMYNSSPKFPSQLPTFPCKEVPQFHIFAHHAQMIVSFQSKIIQAINFHIPIKHLSYCNIVHFLYTLLYNSINSCENFLPYRDNKFINATILLQYRK